jgi:hypothetical protein
MNQTGVNGLLWWQILQQRHRRGQVIVSGDGVDLPLGQLNQCLGLDPLRHGVCAVVRQHVVGEFGGPFELARSQRLAFSRPASSWAAAELHQAKSIVTASADVRQAEPRI